MPASAVHIGGIGISSSPSSPDLVGISVSAGTKALLDAGLTYSKVELSVACFQEDLHRRIPRTCFKAFGKQKAPISAIDNESGICATASWVQSGRVDCALLIGIDSSQNNSGQNTQVAAVALVFVSDRLLNAHAYLKDSAVTLRACQMVGDEAHLAIPSALSQSRLEARDLQIAQVSAGNSSPTRTKKQLGDQNPARTVDSSQVLIPSLGDLGVTGWAGLCGLVWFLRGWMQTPQTGIKNCMSCITRPDGSRVVVAILCRADRGSAPAYREIEHLRDGRERLGYNPAREEKRIGREDLEAVRTRAGDRRIEERAEEVERMRLPFKGGDRATLARL